MMEYYLLELNSGIREQVAVTNRPTVLRETIYKLISNSFYLFYLGFSCEIKT